MAQSTQQLKLERNPPIDSNKIATWMTDGQQMMAKCSYHDDLLTQSSRDKHEHLSTCTCTMFVNLPIIFYRY